MSVKKTGSPLASGAEPIEQLGAKENIARADAVDKKFEAALADAAAELNQPGGATATEGKLQAEFRRIAGTTNFDSPEGEAAAIQESAHALVHSRLGAGFRKTAQGREVAAKLSKYVASDPFLHRKLREILHQLR
ncbi:MAG: hypothetical protein HOP17_01880 [Acidobacteria bacterium]|nr:hypothetical protein [Acidobacteriota bacterium]